MQKGTLGQLPFQPWDSKVEHKEGDSHMFHANPQKPSPRNRPIPNGFSVLELVLVMGMMLALSGIAVPSISNTLRVYQLNSVAGRVADQFKTCRFDAIRRNVPTGCYVTPNSTGYQLWSDSTGTGTYDPTDYSTTLAGAQTLVDSGSIPDSAALDSALGVTGTTTMSGSSSEVSLSFDPRGAVSSSSVVNVFYIAYPGNPSFGYRAVVIMPSGSVQIWTPDGNGSWIQKN